jgi:NADPH:quinone reductase-like Zn-dependent oxidoreductase
VCVGGSKANRLLGPLPHMIGTGLKAIGKSQNVVTFFVASITRDNLVVLGELLEAGEVTPVVEGRYELAETVKALRYLGEGHARGKVVIGVSPQGQASA